mmetsp:Transcript_31146/g.81650  ORF Transcript_31146/g.81650 Transcript_31146/m.81650 type:complete len:128 (-) Transcript_31146:374-757(-)|eukprot:CAMPEP_0182926774 /NCGR_PEP_ID=MMETSP0105_2-20130417/12257_1 /TAXON_ID=81532 ORGANISM="Acanthoeca-like sp., Strain 10tr" /NCGR_SAMPLE_ID=MMETSP0105_2 /ASSEMBLY_ACC=CAM_ASM_000205 /LENGTH=127 /DNA_ID=CAMNT_0025064683 /DNA_START=73 /DNA_END=456 /DNA_ORIENTATION=-
MMRVAMCRGGSAVVTMQSAWAPLASAARDGSSLAGSIQERRTLHSSRVAAAGQKHRMSRGKARSANEYGPLTDLPDWSYEDGTPAPPTEAQIRRERQQSGLLKRIGRLQSEMEHAASRPSGSDDGSA